MLLPTLKYSTNLSFMENVWNFIAFSYKLNTNGYSNTLDFIVKTSTNTFETSISSTNYFYVRDIIFPKLSQWNVTH